MGTIETRSTSLRTADCSPISLRETDRVRLVFIPTLVTNESAPEACVRGHFVYQKKSANDDWIPVASAPLSSLKSGEGFKLELHSAELLTLHRGLSPLFGLYREHGIPRGRNTFVRVRKGLAQFLALGDRDLTTFLESHSEDASVTLLKLVRWLATSPQGAESASRLAALAPEQLPSLNAVLGLAALKNALVYWKENDANSSEDFWQMALGERAYVLSQVFAYPVVIIKSKAYVGGKRITNRGGNLVDFLAAVESTDAVILIEIKTPHSRLLGAEYRDGVFPLSTELAGAIAQALRYRQSLMCDFHSLADGQSKPLTLGEPRCLVIAGHAARELTDAVRRENFELQRERLQGVTVITYDELFRRLERVIKILEAGQA